MFKSLVLVPILPLLFVMTSSCDPYAILRKKGSVAEKDSAAFKYYENGKYEQALYLFEELMPIYRGKPRARDIFYRYAWCQYRMKEVISAAFYFDDFTRQYPRDTAAETFRFMNAYCFYLLSDPSYLDQNYTKQALEAMQLFLNAYPYSPRREKCNEYIYELRERLAEKEFEQANLYHRIGYHKSAVAAFQNVILEFPDSKFREDCQFLLFKSAVLLASASIPDLKESRYLEARSHYEKFVDKFPDSKFVREAENLYETALKQLEKIQTEN